MTEAVLFKALADETRRLILDELQERDEQPLFELCARLAARHGVTASRQAISQHLQVLEDAGLVRARRVGRTKVHTFTPEPLRAIVARWPLSPPHAPHPKES
ncbi:ArsR/SmtB family transcription factor [Nocardioides ferulae]|uniref:ArsR/SmtB family transcription factor n=1 Tax=Nocardioides ferulae TaxID=2340821 RepID=UPI000EAB8F46|nr:metalloregulator ArsR/SmtB family transcription factor [Nocardioides ferulae]